jgi:hypothetical protein
MTPEARAFEFNLSEQASRAYIPSSILAPPLSFIDIYGA